MCFFVSYFCNCSNGKFQHLLVIDLAHFYVIPSVAVSGELWWKMVVRTRFNGFSVKPCKQRFNLGDRLFILCECVFIHSLHSRSLQYTAFRGLVFSDECVQLWMFCFYVQMPVCIVFSYMCITFDCRETFYLCRKMFVLTNLGSKNSVQSSLRYAPHEIKHM